MKKYPKVIRLRHVEGCNLAKGNPDLNRISSIHKFTSSIKSFIIKKNMGKFKRRL